MALWLWFGAIADPAAPSTAAAPSSSFVGGHGSRGACARSGAVGSCRSDLRVSLKRLAGKRLHACPFCTWPCPLRVPRVGCFDVKHLRGIARARLCWQMNRRVHLPPPPADADATLARPQICVPVDRPERGGDPVQQMAACLRRSVCCLACWLQLHGCRCKRGTWSATRR